ncbi:hypothetical protein AB1Y20_019185 [Prymnesium parvum]|uniref:Uncharacterized protein n=1 Tax=Prymnesium parvum TaxID=97485 RepID=A0AB34JTY2_PRYPA
MTASPPRGWPECFNSPELQAYIADELKGQRVRLCGQPGPADLAKLAKLKLSDKDTLLNAQQVEAAVGWKIMGGYVLYEKLDAPPGTCKYTATRRWWNYKTNKDGSPGKWIDASPGRPKELVLVQSAEVPVGGPDARSSAPRASAERKFDHSDTVQQPGKVYSSMSAAVPREFKLFDAQKAEVERQAAVETARPQSEGCVAHEASSTRHVPRRTPVDVHELD